MKNGVLGCSIILVAVLLVPVLCLAYTQAPSYPNYPISAGKEIPNGEFTIYVMKDGGWQKVGSIPYDRYFREKQLSLSDYVSDSWKTRIRIEEKGGGAAHIDSVFVGGRPPLEVKDMADGLRKLSKKDFDVIDASDKSIEVVFVNPVGDKTLRMAARIEPVVNTGIPFQFPPRNLGKTIDTDSSFYMYKLDSIRGGMKKDGSMDEVKSRKPFFKEFSLAGSGHPSNYTYGWVWNDDKDLFVAIDFTSDNTMDGDKDYTKVFVKTDRGVKEFKMSESQTRWGTPAFSYTDKVSYQHKVYKFHIPIQEVLSEGTKKKDEILLAFSAYGTSTATPPCGDSQTTIQSAEGGTNITLESLTPGCYFTGAVQAVASNSLPPSPYHFPFGLVSFTLDCNPCVSRVSTASSGGKQSQVFTPAEASVGFTVDGISDMSQYAIVKFGPTPDNAGNHWYDFEWDAITGTGVQNKSGSSFTAYYVDKNRGDDDLSFYDNMIIDPIGPGQPQTAIPTMTEWGMIIFMVLAGLGSVHFLTNRKGRTEL